MSMSRGWTARLLLPLSLTGAGCGSTGPGEVAGEYDLVMLNGATVPSGSGECGVPVLRGSLRILGATAERSVTYWLNGRERRFTDSGQVTVGGSEMRFTFQEAGGNVWRVRGMREDDHITLSYPAACDGTTTEVYRRD
jgi:hypothetical protein